MQSYELLDLLVILATYPYFLDFPLITFYLTKPFNRTIQVILYKETRLKLAYEYLPNYLNRDNCLHCTALTPLFLSLVTSLSIPTSRQAFKLGSS